MKKRLTIIDLAAILVLVSFVSVATIGKIFP